MEKKFIDLFAGTGGLGLPFRELGWDCVFTSEWDKWAQVSYEANFGSKPDGDITKIDEKSIPKHELLIGGFPCQAFSNAGRKKGFGDTRGTMFFHIERILDFHKPAMILLENVKHLKGHDKGQTFSVILRVLDKIGYDIFFKVLNSNHFGVPQKRERIFIVGLHREKIDSEFSFEFPSPRRVPTQVRDILEKDVPDKYTISDKLWMGHQRRIVEHRQKGNGFGCSVVKPEDPYTRTISRRYYKDGSEALIYQDGKNPRKLTPRECARLQGYPESYKIVVSDNQAYQQFGNAVAVPVVRAIAKKMDKVFENASGKVLISGGKSDTLF